MRRGRIAGELPGGAEVVVVGAGVVGSSVAARLARRGVDVCLIDRVGPAAGTSSSGEGNLLVSDKLPGAELSLALRGLQLWRELAERADGRFEFDPKGGLVVARDGAELAALGSLAAEQRAEGVNAELLEPAELRRLEPALSERLAGGVAYPEDAQVQPMLAVAFNVGELLDHGGRLVPGVEVRSATHDGSGALRSLVTDRGEVAVGRFVVNAAGPWSGELARRLGAAIPVEPRRGHVLVTEPVGDIVRRKVYEAGYVGSIHDADGGWACSAVVEATAGGTMLLGSSREFVGYAAEIDPAIVAAIAERSIALVPVLSRVRLLRCYLGYRPATPDRMPIIGPDPAVGSLLHATGHEGAGVGLAEVTAEIIDCLVGGEAPPLDLAAFAADRFRGADQEALLDRPAKAAPRRRRRPPEHKAAAGPGAVGRPVPLRFSFDGRPLSAPPGSTIAGALWANGVRSWRTTRSGGEPRGLFCGIGTCFDCLVDRNAEKALRACVTRLEDGDALRSADSFGLAAGDA